MPPLAMGSAPVGLDALLPVSAGCAPIVVPVELDGARGIVIGRRGSVSEQAASRVSLSPAAAATGASPECRDRRSRACATLRGRRRPAPRASRCPNGRRRRSTQTKAPLSRMASSAAPMSSSTSAFGTPLVRSTHFDVSAGRKISSIPSVSLPASRLRLLRAVAGEVQIDEIACADLVRDVLQRCEDVLHGSASRRRPRRRRPEA